MLTLKSLRPMHCYLARFRGFRGETMTFSVRAMSATPSSMLTMMIATEEHRISRFLNAVSHRDGHSFR